MELFLQDGTVNLAQLVGGIFIFRTHHNAIEVKKISYCCPFAKNSGLDTTWNFSSAPLDYAAMAFSCTPVKAAPCSFPPLALTGAP